MKIRPVRTISRKGQVPRSGSSALSTVRDAFRFRWCATTRVRSGWQVQHEFSVTQAAPSRAALEFVHDVLGCGKIVQQTRYDNHKHVLLRFSVKRRSELVGVVIPFFKEHPLRTAKQLDFEKFASVLQMMEDDVHLSDDGLAPIASVTETMNRKQRSRYLESSEAIRQPSRTTSR